MGPNASKARVNTAPEMGSEYCLNTFPRFETALCTSACPSNRSLTEMLE